MAEITFDVAAFRSRYPAFADAVSLPDDTLQSYFTEATCYLTNQLSGSLADCLTEQCRTLALNQLTAHICLIAQSALLGKSTGITISATVGSVSTGIATPPYDSSTFAYWLSSTPYGQSLLVLLRNCSAAGFYLGGRCERGAFRKVGGGF